MSAPKTPRPPRPPWPQVAGEAEPGPCAGPHTSEPVEAPNTSSDAPPVPPRMQVSGLTSDLPSDDGVDLTAPLLPDGAILADGHADPAETASSGGGALVGLGLTLAIHVGLVLGVLMAGRGEGRTEPRPPPQEMIIETHILEVQAGNPEGQREEGPAFKRQRPEGQPTPPPEDPSVVLGTSGRPAPPMARSMTPRMPTRPGPDDAANVPGDWGSQSGVPAPPGAKPSDDRYGAGGTADKGALDPCFTQHAQVVAGYRSEVSAKIPPMARPAFISPDVAENLFTSMRVGIDAGGKIVSTQVAKGSGDPRFDSAAVEHVRAVGSFPAPHRCVMYDRQRGLFRSAVTFSVTIKAR